MTVVLHTPRATLLKGDSLELLRKLGDGRVDAVVTDPPYELGFMGKSWDATGIANSVALWTEVLRVLKPGGHLVAFGGTRTYHRMTCAIEDAGFEIRDCLAWMYGTGFPKSLNVGKAIDAAAGAERGKVPRVRSDGKGTGRAQSGFNHAPLNMMADPNPATENDAQWEGWGTALKPAHEPIVLARKPLIGTVAANVQAFGTGALNIDGCRIAIDPSDPNHRPNGTLRSATDVGFTRGVEETKTVRFQQGRWPANVLLDEESARLLDEMSGDCRSGGHVNASKAAHGTGFIGGTTGGVAIPGVNTYSDKGGASRFFYCAKASRKERDAGCEALPAKSGGEATDREDGSAGLTPRAGAGRTGGARNVHPTVKPIALMRWLVRLITPPGGTVLDPFTGSGTTGIAALEEGMAFIGCEQSDDYCGIASARIQSAA